jgi:hypothetical protein
MQRFLPMISESVKKSGSGVGDQHGIRGVDDQPSGQQTIRQEAADEFEFVTRQRDILKKALGILGQDPWNSSK